MDYTPLIYISFGAIIGFIGNYITETYKRKYELKRQTYFEALDYAVKTDQYHHDLFKNGMGIDNWGEKLDTEPYKTWFMTSRLLGLKLEICGGENVKKLIDSLYQQPFEKEPHAETEIILNNLIQIIKEELNKSCWQFWK